MSDFRFACPNCGQRIVADSGYRGTEITCPNCQKSLTIPVIRPQAAASQSFSRTSAESGNISLLAVASLLCSWVLGVGAVAGIICGHLARIKIRRHPSLRGKKFANIGLITSYSSLCIAILFVSYGVFALAPRHGHQLTQKESEANTPAALAPRVVDTVEIGNRESELAHGLKGHASVSGLYADRRWRHADNGGSFSYDLKVDPKQTMSLYCTYWGNDSDPGRLFDILVNGEVIATQKLDFNDPGHFFNVEYSIPRKLTRGTNQVTVVFQARPFKFAGGLFGLQMLKR